MASGIGGSETPLGKKHELANLLLLIDDDLRQTAGALSGIDQFLEKALALIGKPDLSRSELSLLAGDDEVHDRIDALSENLASLRRRMGQIAASLK